MCAYNRARKAASGTAQALTLSLQHLPMSFRHALPALRQPVRSSPISFKRTYEPSRWAGGVLPGYHRGRWVEATFTLRAAYGHIAMVAVFYNLSQIR